jgi:hypothetical protein
MRAVFPSGGQYAGRTRLPSSATPSYANQTLYGNTTKVNWPVFWLEVFENFGMSRLAAATYQIRGFENLVRPPQLWLPALGKNEELRDRIPILLHLDPPWQYGAAEEGTVLVLCRLLFARCGGRCRRRCLRRLWHRLTHLCRWCSNHRWRGKQPVLERHSHRHTKNESAAGDQD